MVSTDDIRERFSSVMSQMYRQEVPQYGVLLDLVARINDQVTRNDPEVSETLRASGETQRLKVERHGAIRLGRPEELRMIARVFAVMGMFPVGYYDLSVAGVPVHSTCFRPITDDALARNPFRVFTSLLRLDLIEPAELRQTASRILEQRSIFTPQAVALVERFERGGGLTSDEADEFVAQVKETFRRHYRATVDRDTYARLHEAHRLIADVVCFRGPHINHLTPRTLDIDAAQAAMKAHGLAAKEVIEGPPRRQVPILLRQTSFKALAESVEFPDESQGPPGVHTARFGEIEQRGAALTRQGRQRYDELLARVRDTQGAHDPEADYQARLTAAFAEFPDDLDELRREGWVHVRYSVMPGGVERAAALGISTDLESLIVHRCVRVDPLVYEDFLPVSAAGIFQSNLGDVDPKVHAANGARDLFEVQLGMPVHDEFELYEQAQARSLDRVWGELAQERA